MNLAETIHRLEALANPEKIIYKENRFGISAKNSLGIYHQDLKIIAKEIGRDSKLAQELFDTGIYEARILCSKIFRLNELTEELMEHWLQTFENWEICDSFSMALFAKSPFAVKKAVEWSNHKDEFCKRSAFSIIAAYCMADKKATNKVFEDFLLIIERESTDDRLYVKKAVNWALRNIGKRNPDLHKSAIATAQNLAGQSNSSAKWIGKNALTELEKTTLRISDYPRSIYR